MPGHDSTNFDTPDFNPHDESLPMYHNTSDQLDDHLDSSHNFGNSHSRSDGNSNFQDGPPKGTSKNRRNSTSSGFMHGAQSGPAPLRRMPHVPFSGLRSGANVTYLKKLYCDDGESEDTRWAILEKIAEMDIPQTRHRNSSTLKDTEKFDTAIPCISVRKFIARCAMNGIYVPPLSAFTEESCMGREYECNILPKEIYEDVPLMRRSGKEDLIHIT